MSDQTTLYGEKDLERQLGYSDMPLANPLPKEYDDTPGPEPVDPYAPISPAEAAEQLSNPRNRPLLREEPTPEELPAIKREYSQVGGNRHGEHLDERLVVSAEQAAHDLAAVRQQDEQLIENAEDQQVRDAIDQLRAGTAEPEQQTTQAQPEVPQPQPEAQPQDNQARLQEMLRDPVLLDAVQQQVAAQTQQAEQARQAYVAAVTQNATLAVANIASRHAELRGLPFESWPAVLQSLANSNPQRHSQIMSEFASARNVFDQFERAAADQTQRYQQQLNQAASQMQQRFQADANFADSQLDQYRQQQGISDAEFKELRAEALNQLRQAGYSDQDIAIQYNSNPQFRSFYAQQQMLNSARWALAQRSLATKVAPKAVPPMQRPGSPLLVARDRDVEMRQLEKTLNHSSSVKDATRVLLARREMAKRR